ncbi:hypothetical protein HWV62_25338 [Athelia sp. TMB]|nr:hypothetical protein HWV62_25338 [Athelia sp. TMB]
MHQNGSLHDQVSLASVSKPTAMNGFHTLYFLWALQLAYFFGSFTALGKWIAVQQLPTTSEPRTELMASDLKRKKKIVLGIAVTVVSIEVAIGFGLRLLVDKWREEWDVYFEYLKPAFWVLACNEWFGMPMAFHRKPCGGKSPKSPSHIAKLMSLIVLGKLGETTTSRRVAMKLAIAIISVGLPVGAVCYSSDACAAAMVFVVVYNFQGCHENKTNSLRKLIINIITFGTVMLSYLAIVASIVASSASEGALIELRSMVGRADWAFLCFLAILSSNLLPTILRFDYAIRVEAVESAAPLIAIETAPAPNAIAPGKQLTAGAMVPAFWAVMLAPFKRIYFGFALMAHYISHFIASILIAKGILPDLGCAIYIGYILLISTPLIIATLVTVALLRGEAKLMWKYEEVWEPNPVAPTAVEELAVDCTYGGKEKVGVLVDV